MPNIKEAKRGKRKILKGIVVSDKMNKTRVVVVERHIFHQKFKKYYIKKTKCYVHDENNISKTGDIVEIMETRPLSRLKRWRLLAVKKSESEQKSVGGSESGKIESSISKG
jgi:small subunit ribosomal protein S17